MIVWPQPLVAEIAERRCVLFVGAGVSMFSSAEGGGQPPNWPSLLAGLVELMADERSKEAAQALIQSNNYLDAAEVIRSTLSPAEYMDYIQQHLDAPRYRPADIHRTIRDLDVKAVVTTNYDRIYDGLCQGDDGQGPYAVCRYHDTNLVDEIRSTRRLIVKAHGCVSDLHHTVLSRSDFFNARSEYPSFFATLDAIFVTHTILFLGYSLNDPDIRLVLESSNIRAPSARPHYAVVEAGRHQALAQATKRSYNVQLLEHAQGNYNEVEASLVELRDRVIEYRSVHD